MDKIHITIDGSQSNRVPTYCGLPGLNHITISSPAKALQLGDDDICQNCMLKWAKRKERVRK